MTFGRRPSRSSPRRGNSGPPAWIIFLVGVALVFGGYYVFLGIQNFLRTGGQGVIETTQQAVIISTATAESFIPTPNLTPVPSSTPVPECIDFIVSVPSAIVRETPNAKAAILTSLSQNESVCVLGRPSEDSEWYTIDQNPGTRRLEIAYMHESVVQAVAPTPTPSRTPTPPPTVTPTLTYTPAPTVPTNTPAPTETIDPDITNTPTPTLTPSSTQPRQSA